MSEIDEIKETDQKEKEEKEEKEEREESRGTKKGKGGFFSFVASLPLAVKIFYICGIVSAFIYFAYTLSEPFSDFVNRYISSVYRAVFAYLTGWIPFSFAEYLVILIPVILVALVWVANKYFADSWTQVFRFCASLLSVLALFFSAFTLGFAPGYHGSSLDKKLDIERAEVSAEELYHTASILRDKVNGERENVIFRTKSFSVMPYTYAEMNDKLIDAYDVACGKYPFIQHLDSNIKPIMLSEAMSYTHITGVYTFFTGEANINVDFPDYTIPYTAAHELAHQRGIAREDEANFVAYLVCIESEDAYIRYSGYINLLEYVLNALYKADPVAYYEIINSLCIEARYEMNAYSEFFDKYRDSVASEISGAVNDTYLTIQGTPGTASYGMVVDLAVAYYRNK